jgi:hypothetical protein
MDLNSDSFGELIEDTAPHYPGGLLRLVLTAASNSFFMVVAPRAVV